MSVSVPAAVSSFFTGLGTMFYMVPIKVDDSAGVPDYIGQGIAFFFLMVGLEMLYGFVKNVKLYSFKDTVMSFSLGIVQQLIGLWMKELSVIPYTAVYIYSAPWRDRVYSQIGNLCANNSVCSSINFGSYGPYVYFIIAMLGCDLAYYFVHRYAHEFHLLWMAHSVHHSGERYNLASALRQGTFQSTYSWMFYLPLAVIGLPAFHYRRHNQLNTLYQFWIHTEAVGVLWAPIECIFNTPSHHRLHHRPPGNCNYAGVLIIWDRIFGTFVSELMSPDINQQVTLSEKEPNVKKMVESHPGRGAIYGLAKPLDSFHPIFANLNHFYKLYETSGQSFLSYVFQFSYLWQKRNCHGFKINYRLNDLVPELGLYKKRSGSAFGLPAILRLESTAVSSSDSEKKVVDQVFKRDLAFQEERKQREGSTPSVLALVVYVFLFLLVVFLALGLLLSNSADSSSSFQLPTSADPVSVLNSIASLPPMPKVAMCLLILEIMPCLYPSKATNSNKNKQQ